MNLRDLINKPKDLALRYFLQSYFKKYINHVLEFSIDAKNKSIHTVVELKGEETPPVFSAAASYGPLGQLTSFARSLRLGIGPFFVTYQVLGSWRQE